MSTTLLYATTNPGKLMEVGKHLKPHGISLVSPAQLGIRQRHPMDRTTETLASSAASLTYPDLTPASIH